MSMQRRENSEKETILTVCSGLFPDFIGLVTNKELTGKEELFPAESSLIETASPLRRKQFSQGRACAHLAVRKIGLEPGPVLKGKKGEPLWQAGVTGSISHSHGLCAAAAASLEACRCIGLDIESLKPRGKEVDITRYVCREEEREMLDSSTGKQFFKLSRLIFSAKESFYKCLFPLTGIFFGFKNVRIQLDRTRGSFAGTIVEPFHPDFPAGYCLKGRFAVTSDFVWTGIVAFR